MGEAVERVRGRPLAAERVTPVVADRVLTGLTLVGVALAAILPYLGNLSGYFLADDFGLIALFSKKPTFHVLTLFTNAWTESIYGIHADELRPTVALSYQVDSLWGAANPLGYHLTSLTLHLLCVLLVLSIARRVARLGRPAAAFAAMLFAVLPSQAEPVVWISGRADSIPTLFYLAAFLGFALWRRTGRPAQYGAALVAFFFGLFSKQSAITMVAMLGSFDLLVERRRPRLAWSWVRDYLPFVALTVGYIGLRMVLFGNAVREQSLTPDALAAFVVRLATYVKMMAVGSALVGADEISPDLALAGRLAVWALLTVALLAALVEMVRVARGRPGAWWAPLLFFGPLWWTISVVPMVVTYESARHLYQASAGVAVAFGVGFEALWVGDRLRRAAAVLAATALIVLGTKQLDQPLEVWQHSGRISARIQQDLNHELVAAPAGSLIVVAPPPVGASDLYPSWLRMWSMPFAVEPPFAPPGLAERVALVVPPDVYCCPRDQWYAATRAALTAWASQPDRGPIIVLRWDGWSGGLIRRTERDDAQLPGQMLAVGAAPTPATMCQQLDAVVGNLAASCTDS